MDLTTLCCFVVRRPPRSTGVNVDEFKPDEGDDAVDFFGDESRNQYSAKVRQLLVLITCMIKIQVIDR